METRRFCVYNQTSECFLSLGAIPAENMMAHFKSLVGRHTQRYDEGLWVVPSSGFHSFRLGASVPLDLVYLDRNYRVVHLVESFHKFRIAPVRFDAASVLALPPHTIYSSQTQLGNQLVICVAEEMEFQLGSSPAIDRHGEIVGPDQAAKNVNWLANYLDCGTGENRRKSRRQMWPRLVAHDWDGAELAVHGIRDASATGLYLLTEKRWPLGALVWMTLQRTDGVEESSESSITVQMEVTRWGPDGVGLVFRLPETMQLAQPVDQEQPGADLEEAAMQEERAGFVN